MRQVIVKPHDLVLSLKLALRGGRRYTFSNLGKELALSPSEAHAAADRLTQAGLLLADRSEGLIATKPALRDFVLNGVKYVYPATLGPPTRGMPTAESGPTLREQIISSDDGATVWPLSTGASRGPALCPLYPGAPKAALLDPQLYEILSLIDALRIGPARTRELAVSEVTRLLS